MGFIIPGMVNVVVELILRAVSYRDRQTVWSRCKIPIIMWVGFSLLYINFYMYVVKYDKTIGDFKQRFIADHKHFTFVMRFVFLWFVLHAIVLVLFYLIIVYYGRAINLPNTITTIRKALTLCSLIYSWCFSIVFIVVPHWKQSYPKGTLLCVVLT